jgi:hypothetical protein
MSPELQVTWVNRLCMPTLLNEPESHGGSLFVRFGDSVSPAKWFSWPRINMIASVLMQSLACRMEHLTAWSTLPYRAPYHMEHLTV